ncbi:hypothetical protein GCM10009634_71770 [Saccharothrix xinjiangensis]
MSAFLSKGIAPMWWSGGKLGRWSEAGAAELNGRIAVTPLVSAGWRGCGPVRRPGRPPPPRRGRPHSAEEAKEAPTP